MGVLVHRRGLELDVDDWTNLDALTGRNLSMRLFNAPTLQPFDANLADFSEAVFTGYAPINFTTAANVPKVLGANLYQTKLKNAAFVWVCTAAPETIYGWFLLDSADGTVIFSEVWATPEVLEVGTRITQNVDLQIVQG